MPNEKHEMLIEREGHLIEKHWLIEGDAQEIEGHEMLGQRERVPVDVVVVEMEGGLVKG